MEQSNWASHTSQFPNLKDTPSMVLKCKECPTTAIMSSGCWTNQFSNCLILRVKDDDVGATSFKMTSCGISCGCRSTKKSNSSTLFTDDGFRSGCCGPAGAAHPKRPRQVCRARSSGEWTTNCTPFFSKKLQSCRTSPMCSICLAPISLTSELT